MALHLRGSLQGHTDLTIIICTPTDDELVERHLRHAGRG